MSIDSDDLATLRGLLDACKSGNCADHDDFGRRIGELYDYLDPETVSALVSDLEQRGERTQYWMDQANEIARDRAKIREERDQLKAELDELKEIKAYVTLPLRERCAERTLLRAENDALRECVDDLALSLECEVKARYAGTQKHPAIKPKYDGDMQEVLDARKLLSRGAGQ